VEGPNEPRQNDARQNDARQNDARQIEPRWLSNDERDAWIALCWLMFKLPTAFDAQLQRDSGISLFEYQVLSGLSMSPDRRVRMSDLAQFANGSLSRLSNVVKRLEQRGWISREPCTENGRFVDATLTSAGWAVVEGAAPGHVEAVRRHVLDALRPDQVAGLRDISRQIAKQVDPQHTWPPFSRPAAAEA
jgi:DNA-binding MarR family transcriptional regulator